MKNKEAIVAILKKHFSCIYCDTCASRDNKEYCDDCNRKAMGWAISDTEAERVTNEILESLKNVDKI